MKQPALTAIPQHIVSTHDYQQQARHHIDDNAWHYLVGGAGDEITVNANEHVFQQYLLTTKVLSDVRGGHTQLSLFGRHYQHPIFLAPVAYQTLFHPQGERATALAAHVMNTPFTVSSLSSTLLEDIRTEDEQDLWFQLYFQAQRQQTLSLVKRAERAGYQVLIVTVDAPLAGIRNREQRMGFQLPSHVQAVNLTQSGGAASHHQSESFVFNQLMANAPTWEDITWLLSVIIVSNHGGRILDGVLPSLTALPDIIKAVNGRVPVLFDGGIRRGSDVFKALALGASAVFIGRPYIYALASAGALGVAHLIRTLREELEITMALCGCKDLSVITRACVIKNGEVDV